MVRQEVFRKVYSMAKTNEKSHRTTYICSFEGCCKSFSRRDRLIIHQRTHTGEKPFACDVEGCDKRYARSAHLQRHYEHTHTSRVEHPTFRCEAENCGQVFTSKCNLQKHVKRKHETQRYVCQHCQKSFTKHQHLKVHQYEHTHINPFQCTHEGCTMSFRVPSLLRRHMKVHMGYRCSVDGCEAVFSKWTLYRKHKAQEHSPEHMFTCMQCSKQFSQKQWLKQHMKIHSDQRELFVCPRENCGRSYLDQRNLLAHIRSYHDGRRFPCQHPGCDRKFSSEQKQRQHQKVHNPESKPVKVKRKKKSIAEKLTGVNIKEIVHLATDREDRITLDDDGDQVVPVSEQGHQVQGLLKDKKDKKVQMLNGLDKCTHEQQVQIACQTPKGQSSIHGQHVQSIIQQRLACDQDKLMQTIDDGEKSHLHKKDGTMDDIYQHPQVPVLCRQQEQVLNRVHEVQVLDQG